jgi:hypothetical protein
MDHHEPHQQRADLVLGREAEGDGGDDGHGAGADRPDGGEHGGQREHDPGDRADSSPNGPHRQLHQPVDGAVVLRHREQVGDPDQGEEQVAGEPGDDVVGGLVGDQGADQEGPRERQDPDVDRQQGGDHEDQPEDQDRDEFRRHRHPPS